MQNTPDTLMQDKPWVVQGRWECNWTTVFYNDDGSCRTFATREEAARALIDYAGTVSVRVPPSENVDGSWRTFATREEAEHAVLEPVGAIYIPQWREEVRIVDHGP